MTITARDAESFVPKDAAQAAQFASLIGGYGVHPLAEKLHAALIAQADEAQSNTAAGRMTRLSTYAPAALQKTGDAFQKFAEPERRDDD